MDIADLFGYEIKFVKKQAIVCQENKQENS